MDAGNEVVAQVKLLQMWQQLDAFGAPENIALQRCMLLNAIISLGSSHLYCNEKHTDPQFC